ncbi:hypothetical protein P4493_05825 [Bacillus thuringiensis]|uniref:Uncharacterized protein n=3 Tax=Bacillus thuringiensis TaxID=1428 RepID=A0A0B5NCK7_BACTU|nr:MULTISPECIES: hypothetical protein [Bacillus]MEC2533081.1 hypothetical protein [Bacillus cereus]MED1153939.1 hypothetical protein [Bacillus paranthracis]OUB09221.1 hypothetical protein BK708_32310 [Bacillus thuringiensis serovar yunnanensis]AFQ29811.1 hypothetical protein BTF1_28552 [Bacillus thuringiensis HD-789]AJG74105.1 hypothetical protein BF38_6055 [Bacillus thuringiensis]
MKVELKYRLRGFNLKLLSGVVSEEDEVVFVSPLPELMEKFLTVTGIELHTVDNTSTISNIVTIESNVDYNLVYKTFNKEDELDNELIQIITKVNGFNVEGWLGVYDKTIVVYHLSQELSDETLKSLEKEFLSSNILVDTLAFQIPVING